MKRRKKKKEEEERMWEEEREVEGVCTRSGKLVKLSYCKLHAPHPGRLSRYLSHDQKGMRDRGKRGRQVSRRRRRR